MYIFIQNSNQGCENLNIFLFKINAEKNSYFFQKISLNEVNGEKNKNVFSKHFHIIIAFSVFYKNKLITFKSCLPY